jgi:nickel/cobalt transporter (NicO) family protein
VIVNSTTPALIAAAAGVGFGHAILADHWVPLAVVGRTQRYPLARVARLSGLAGIAHVLVSLMLGALIIVIGLQFRSTVEHAQDAIVGGVLLATGLGFIALELTGYGHSHSRGHGHSHGRSHADDDHHGSSEHVDEEAATQSHWRKGPRGLAAIMIPFGAAASPDLTILPVFLAAAAVGAGTAVGSQVAFGVVTITTIIALTLLATVGGYQVRGNWLERWGNATTAAVLLIIGTLVLTGTM